MSEPMMRLGSFTFSLETAAYQEFQRATEYTWASQARFGQDDALQSTGNGPDNITLPGVVFPEFRGGTGQLDALRALAAQKLPQTLIDGRGRILGEWVITNVDERGDTFAAAGVARRMEFNIKLRRFQEEEVTGLVAVADFVLEPGVLPTTALLNNALAVSATAEKGPIPIMESLNSSLATLSGMAATLGSYSNNVLGAVRSGINAGKTLQYAGTDTARLLASAKNLANLPSVMNGLVNVSGDVARATGASSSLLGQATSAMTDSATFNAVRDAMISTNKMTVLAVQVRTAAQSAGGGA